MSRRARGRAGGRSRSRRPADGRLDARRAALWFAAASLTAGGLGAWALISSSGSAGQVGEPVPIMADLGEAPAGAGPTAYNSVPPTSGPHASWTLPEWGVYNAFIPPEVQVHHLAHGEVIVHYRPDAADPADVERLRRIVREIGRGVLMHPNPEIDHPIVLTAWGRILRLEALEEPLVRRFIDQYRTLLPQH